MIVEALPFQTHLTVSKVAASEPRSRERLADLDRMDIPDWNLDKSATRGALVRRIREEVAMGTYLSPTKLDAAAGRLRAVLTNPESLS